MTFECCHARDYARIDIRIDEHGQPWVLELNSMASLGTGGSYTRAAEVASYSFENLVNRIVDIAHERYYRTPAPRSSAPLPTTPLRPPCPDSKRARLTDGFRCRSARTSPAAAVRDRARRLRRRRLQRRVLVHPSVRANRGRRRCWRRNRPLLLRDRYLGALTGGLLVSRALDRAGRPTVFWDTRLRRNDPRRGGAEHTLPRLALGAVTTAVFFATTAWVTAYPTLMALWSRPGGAHIASFTTSASAKACLPLARRRPRVERRLAAGVGKRDPVATSNVLAGLRELQPAAPVSELPELGHYPQIEQPERITALVDELASGSTG